MAARRPPRAPRAGSRSRNAAARSGSRAVAGGPGGEGRVGREAPRPDDPPHHHDRIDVAALLWRSHGRDVTAGGAGAVRARVARLGLRAQRSEGADPQRDGRAARTRAAPGQPVLLRRGDDEADWRGACLLYTSDAADDL